MTRTGLDDDSSKPESRNRYNLLCGTTLTAAYLLCCTMGTTSPAQQTTGAPGSSPQADAVR